MTRTLPAFPTRWVAIPGLVVLALIVAGLVFQASARPAQPPRFAIVVDTSSGPAPAAVASAAAAIRSAERATGAEGQLRVTHTPTEQLSVTHLLAADGYDAVIGVGLDERVAVTPVAERFPGTRFARAGSGDLPAAVSASLR